MKNYNIKNKIKMGDKLSNKIIDRNIRKNNLNYFKEVQKIKLQNIVK